MSKNMHDIIPVSTIDMLSDTYQWVISSGLSLVPHALLPFNNLLFHLSLLANEIIWQIIMKLNNALPLKFREARAKYVKATPRWKICNHITNDAFTFATTLLYVNKHLPKNATKTVIVLIFCTRGRPFKNRLV